MKPNPKEMPLQDLIARYVEIGIAQSEALDRFETAKFNRLYDRKEGKRQSAPMFRRAMKTATLS